MIRVAASSLALVAGCGRIGFEPVSDAGVSDAGGSPSCVFGPFGAPTDSSASEFGPAITGGGLTMYFSSEAGGNRDLYVATRSGLASPFGLAVALATIDTRMTR